MTEVTADSRRLQGRGALATARHRRYGEGLPRGPARRFDPGQGKRRLYARIVFVGSSEIEDSDKSTTAVGSGPGSEGGTPAPQVAGSRHSDDRRYEPSVFRAHPWLRGGHLQTVASFFLPRRIHLPVAEERLVEVAPGVKLRCWCHWQGTRREDRVKPLTLIVVHGLEGSHESQYMLGVARNGLAAGMNVVRMNQRNCGGMNSYAPTLYNSSLSGDVAAVARHVVEHDGVSQFALAGFSMGGNLVLKLAGEWGREGAAEFRAVAAVCPAMDLAASADALHAPENRIYEYYFLWQLFRRFREKARIFPKDFDAARLKGVSSLRLFDDRVTAHYCGFAGADDYYARAAAANVVERIAVPALIIHAANDPFIRLLPATREKILGNPNITYVEADDGGHCAFLGKRDGVGDDGRWAEREIVEFVRQVM